jgi:hypothetical protein
MGGLATLGVALLATALVPVAANAAPRSVRSKLKAASAPASELVRTDTVGLPGGVTVYRFQQQVDGVPVDAAEAVVADAPGAPPALVTDATESGIAAPGEAAVSRANAVATAAGAVNGHSDGRGRAGLVISPSGDGTLAWDVVFATARPYGNFEVLVDADSGRVLHRYDLLRQLQTAQAQLYVPNAVTENDGYDTIAKVGRDEGRGKDKDKDTALLTSLREPVTLPNLRDGQDCLRGLWATAKVGKKASKVCRPSLNFSGVTRHDNKFEALMSYHAIDRTQTYIQSLGFAGANGANDESQLVIADAIPDDNSFYAPVHDWIQLGTGGVDDAEDQDVIIHEYGHSVQDAQVKGFGRKPQGGAMGEGFGDYLAAAMSAETPGVPDHAAFDPCVMEWDATSYAPLPSCLRRTDNPNTWDEQRDDCSPPTEVHCIGEVWSSALWSLRGELGDDGLGDSIMDKLVIASHFLETKDARFADGANALLSADDTLYGSAHCEAIGDEMVTRGFLATAPSC